TNVMPKEVQRLRNRCHERLRFRQVQGQFLSKIRRKRSFLSVRGLLGTLLRGRPHQENEVIRIPDRHTHRSCLAPIVRPRTHRPELNRCWVGERSWPVARPDVTLVPFLDRGQRDVGQQGRQNATLRGSGLRSEELLLRQDPRLQEGENKSINLVVPDATT